MAVPRILFIVSLMLAISPAVVSANRQLAFLRGGGRRVTMPTKRELKKSSKMEKIDALNIKFADLTAQKKQELRALLLGKIEATNGKTATAARTFKQKLTTMPKLTQNGKHATSKHPRKLGVPQSWTNAAGMTQNMFQAGFVGNRPSLADRLSVTTVRYALDSTLDAAEQAAIGAIEASIPEAFQPGSLCDRANAVLDTTKTHFDYLIDTPMESIDNYGYQCLDRLDEFDTLKEDLETVDSSVTTATSILTILSVLPMVGGGFNTAKETINNAKKTFVTPVKKSVDLMATSVVNPMKTSLDNLLVANAGAAEKIELAKYTAEKYILQPARVMDAVCPSVIEGSCVTVGNAMTTVNAHLATFRGTLDALAEGLGDVRDVLLLVADFVSDGVYQLFITFFRWLDELLAPISDFLNQGICVAIFGEDGDEVADELDSWTGLEIPCDLTLNDILGAIGDFASVIIDLIGEAFSALGINFPTLSDLLDIPGLIGIPDLFDLPTLSINLPQLTIGCGLEFDSGRVVASGSLAEWPDILSCSPFDQIKNLQCPTSSPTASPTSSPTLSPTSSPTRLPTAAPTFEPIPDPESALGIRLRESCWDPFIVWTKQNRASESLWEVWMIKLIMKTGNVDAAITSCRKNQLTLSTVDVEGTVLAANRPDGTTSDSGRTH